MFISSATDWDALIWKNQWRCFINELNVSAKRFSELFSGTPYACAPETNETNNGNIAELSMYIRSYWLNVINVSFNIGYIWCRK